MEEYWGTCKTGSTIMSCRPGQSNLPRLDQYAFMFETYRILRWAVRFTVRVGSTVSGMYIAGPCYVPGDTAKTIASVAALSPKVHNAIWQPGTLNVPAARLMKQKWMIVPGFDDHDTADSYPGSVCVYVDGANCAIDAWVSYEVEFSGPTAGKRSTASLVYESKSHTWKFNGVVITELPADSEDQFSIDVDSSDSGLIETVKSWFKESNVVDHLTAGSRHLWHLLVHSTVKTVLPQLSQDAILYFTPRPFLALQGGTASTGSLGHNKEAEEEVEESGGSDISPVEAKSGAGVEVAGDDRRTQFGEDANRVIEKLCERVRELECQLGTFLGSRRTSHSGSSFGDLGNLRLPDEGEGDAENSKAC